MRALLAALTLAVPTFAARSMTGPTAAVKLVMPAPFPGKALTRKGPMKIDTDGLIADPVRRKAVLARDPWHKNTTSLTLEGRALDATVIPYIVLPKGWNEAEMGDIARVWYQGRYAWAVCGDRGPRRKFGEGSVRLAEKLGIDPDGTSGGVPDGVTYEIFPGTRAHLPDTHRGLAVYLNELEAWRPLDRATPN